MKKAICLICIFLITLTLTAQEKASIALIPLNTSEGVAQTELIGFSTILEASFIGTNTFRVIAQTERDTILEEQSFSLSGCADQTCAVEIGKLLSADYLINGSINKSGSRYIVSINLMSVESGEIERNAMATLYSLSSIEELKSKSRTMANTIAGIEEEKGYSNRQVESYTGGVAFRVSPASATLTFNLSDEYTDFPVEIEDFPVGEYPVRVIAEGFRPYITSVKVEKGETRELEIILESAGADVIIPKKGKGFLSIYTSPPGMAVSIDRHLLPEDMVTPLINYEMDAGEHEVSVGDYNSEYEYFQAEEGIHVYIEEGASEELNLELPRKKGRLRISANVPDAEVFVNGTGHGFLSNGSISLSGLECGESEVSLYHDKFETGMEKFNIRPGMNNSLEFTLAPLPVAMMIDSNPQGAEVFLNNESRGRTPVVLDDVAQGSYSYYFVYNDYRTSTARIEVMGTEDYTVIEDLTNSLTIRLSDAVEDGAYVYLDGKENPVGIIEDGSFSLPYIGVGNHSIRIEKEGYRTEERRIEVPTRKEGRVTDLVLDLTIHDIPYIVHSQPRGALIYVDGVDTGQTTPATINLSEGTHEITLAKIGFLRLKETVVVDSTKGEMIRLNLPEGNDPSVMLEYYDFALKDLGPGSAIDDIHGGIAQVNTFKSELGALDIETGDLAVWLDEKKGNLYLLIVDEKLKLLEEPVSGDVFNLSEADFKARYQSLFDGIEEFRRDIFSWKANEESRYLAMVDAFEEGLREKQEVRLSAAEDIAGRMASIRQEKEAVLSQKKSQDFWSVFFGVTTGAALGGTGYSVWQTADNYQNYQSAEFSNLAEEYRAAADTWTLASGVGLGTTLVTGIIEVILLSSRKRTINRLDDIRSRQAVLAADAAKLGLSGTFGGVE